MFLAGQNDDFVRMIDETTWKTVLNVPLIDDKGRSLWLRRESGVIPRPHINLKWTV